MLLISDLSDEKAFNKGVEYMVELIVVYGLVGVMAGMEVIK